MVTDPGAGPCADTCAGPGADPGPNAGDAPFLGVLGTLQLADSAFPAGLYAFSHGLESAVHEGWVRTAADLEAFLADWLAWQVGPGDAVVAAAAHRAAAAGDAALLVEIDRAAGATKLAREGREASVKTGARLLATAVVIAPGHAALAALQRAAARRETPGTYAAAFGAAAAALGAPAAAAVLAELHGAATGLLGAALRLMRIDHQQTQAILRRQAPRLTAIAAAALAADWRELRPSAPYAEILQMRHETAHVRLFSS